ncbi:family 43 glycosylhydrolase [Hyphomonas sp.]|uniref:family 43 glycosylhydrolase n=1 Tax=Hyphomonas sp. TaxID=87 RepID=UPI0025C1B16F|nr:family 43 glycosylhydrolase [Hyphomonas sp.]
MTTDPREGLLSPSGERWSGLAWARGFEGQRRADLGNGKFLNPVFAGDHPDPSVLRDGDTYYMTCSSFDAYPGLVIWKSTDLVNWSSITAALTTPIGSVWAPELCKHAGRYYLYIPARFPNYRSNYVIWADRIEGPWSDPIDLKLPAHIDPGHAVGEDSHRYLFLSGGDRVRLSEDGLSTIGQVEHVYDPWRYPDEWTVEGFSPEGPKITRRGDWFYMITAVGGTAGPPTGHMVIVARSSSIHGPWEDCPHNPIVRTWSADEKWWSRGHATLVEGSDGNWWMAYHGYENGFWTLGRQMLLDPVDWSADGWPIARGGDLSKPLRKPSISTHQTHGQPLSDNFSTNRLGTLWAFYNPGPDESSRFRLTQDGLALAAKGTGPANTSPLCFVCGDLAYEVEADIELANGTEAGLLLFYSKRLYAGLGFDANGLVMHRYGRSRRGRAPENPGNRLFVRIRNDRHIVTMYTRREGSAWEKYGVQMEVSGYHHNTDGDFLSLRPALYACGGGEARIRNVTYRAL